MEPRSPDAANRHAAFRADLVAYLASVEPSAAAEPSLVRVVRAPGRVNLIGEHTDYNQGYVLPAAIDLGITIAFVPNDNRTVTLTLLDGGDRDGFDLDAIGARTGRWIDYVAGTAWALAEAGVPMRGFHGVLTADLPSGAGLSSSAALELASAWALTGGEVPASDRMRFAQAAQRAENAYLGVASGFMDQFAVAFGVADHALLLDCRTMESRAIALPMSASLVICHSGSPRRLATTEYNTRRAECKRAVAAIRSVRPEVQSLRDATMDDLGASLRDSDDVAFRRARHVVTENARTLAAVAAFEAGDLPAVGRLFSESHGSLRDDFEVSSPALDALVEIAGQVPGVYGTRLTGAGFGGCTISLVASDAIEPLRQAVTREYPQRTGLVPRVFEVKAGDGVGLVARQTLESQVGQLLVVDVAATDDQHGRAV